MVYISTFSGFSTGALQCAKENMPSALAHPEVVDEYL